jgi:hypothetical protein
MIQVGRSPRRSKGRAHSGASCPSAASTSQSLRAAREQLLRDLDEETQGWRTLSAARVAEEEPRDRRCVRFEHQLQATSANLIGHPGLERVDEAEALLIDEAVFYNDLHLNARVTRERSAGRAR